MITRSWIFKTAGITVGLGTLLFLFQNCSNKQSLNLEAAIKYADNQTLASASDPKDPILLTFANAEGGSAVDSFSAGQTIYASVSSAGSSGLVCSEKDAQRNCLSNFPNPSYWTDLFRSGWAENRSQNKWSRQFSVGSDVTTGTYRFYFVRPKVADPTKANNFGSVEIQIQ